MFKSINKVSTTLKKIKARYYCTLISASSVFHCFTGLFRCVLASITALNSIILRCESLWELWGFGPLVIRYLYKNATGVERKRSELMCYIRSILQNENIEQKKTTLKNK